MVKLKRQVEEMRQQLQEANQRHLQLQQQPQAPETDVAVAVSAALRSEQAAHAAERAKIEDYLRNQVWEELL